MQADADRAKEIFLGAIVLSNRVERNEYVTRSCGANAELKEWVDGLLAIFDQAALAPLNANATTDLDTGSREAVPPLPIDATTDFEPAPIPPTLPPGEANATTDFDTGVSQVAARDPEDPTATSDYQDATSDNPDASPTQSSDLSHSTASFDGEANPAAGRKFPGVKKGSVIAGRYTLLSVIGEGGMGSVYLARQTEPIKRDVALKLIKKGQDSRSVLARFESERQALALMEHPNIARVYDGGSTPDGAPFFAMELVRGEPITSYCDSNRVSLAGRLELFVQVCRAVQHAHQKGIIHRDLKPGNILVTEVDGKPTPKVIDFGVAKATEQRLTDMSFNDLGSIVGTPVYMSPEQADPSKMDVDTRTDVYALGVVLYELLTGSPPIRAEEFRRGAILEMLRMVREVEPPRPSTRASSDRALPNIAANRAVEPSQLLSLLRGDIDWIIMKAIDKNREQRYDSANSFASDVMRYLANETVVARPPTLGYRVRKFVRRNRTGVTAAASFVLFGLIGIAAVIYQWQEAVYQKTQAVIARNDAVTAKTEAETNFGIAMEQRMVALKAVGQTLDIARKELPNVPAAQDVRKKVLKISSDTLKSIAENPLVQVSLKDTSIAAVHEANARLSLTLGDIPEAIEEFRRAEAIFERILQNDPEPKWRDTVKQNLALVKMDLARASLRMQKTAEARAHLDQAIELIGQVGPEAPPDFRRNLAELHRYVGILTSSTNLLEARKIYGDSLRISEELVRESSNEVNTESLINSYLLVSKADFRLRDNLSSEKYSRLAITIAEGELAKSNSNKWKEKVAIARDRYGEFLMRTGKNREAIPEYRAALEVYRKQSEDDPKNVDKAANVSRVLYSLALAEERIGDKPSAQEHYNQSLKIRADRVRNKSESEAIRDLMVTQARCGKIKEAIETAEVVLKDHPKDKDSLLDVAFTFAISSAAQMGDAVGKLEAERLANRAMQALRSAVDLGYADIVNLETEPDLDGVREREDFKSLLARIQSSK